MYHMCRNHIQWTQRRDERGPLNDPHNSPRSPPQRLTSAGSLDIFQPKRRKGRWRKYGTPRHWTQSNYCTYFYEYTLSRSKTIIVVYILALTVQYIDRSLACVVCVYYRKASSLVSLCQDEKKSSFAEKENNHKSKQHTFSVSVSFC